MNRLPSASTEPSVTDEWRTSIAQRGLARTLLIAIAPFALLILTGARP